MEELEFGKCLELVETMPNDQLEAWVRYGSDDQRLAAGGELAHRRTRRVTSDRRSTEHPYLSEEEFQAIAWGRQAAIDRLEADIKRIGSSQPPIKPRGAGRGHSKQPRNVGGRSGR